MQRTYTELTECYSAYTDSEFKLRKHIEQNVLLSFCDVYKRL